MIFSIKILTEMIRTYEKSIKPDRKEYLMNDNYSAKKRWDIEHPKKRRYINDKSATKRFIKIAKNDDLKEIKKLVDEELDKKTNYKKEDH